MGVQAVLGILVVLLGLQQNNLVLTGVGAMLFITYPFVWAHLITIPLIAAKKVYVDPKQAQLIKKSARLFEDHPAAKVAVAGSYGKTTMKEMLATVLKEGKKVAATPANKNVAISHAQFIQSLDGSEEILIIEYGEGAPGDVARFADTTHPTHAVITGLAPAHLDKYITIEAAAEDILSVTNHVAADNVYINSTAATQPYISKSFNAYSEHGVGDWKILEVTVSLEGISFSLQYENTKLRLRSALLGRHQIGPLSAAAVLGLKLGLTIDQIEAGIAKTRPFEHRMQPYQLGGAWIIDDTYNGNLEGIRAGAALLRELPATRKWYVTPGLVDQGKDAPKIHQEIGHLIAAAEPDIVVLMRNSVTEFIQKGLEEGGYAGEVRIESDPLGFYTNLEHFVTGGDVVIMQNDWTDNYA